MSSSPWVSFCLTALPDRRLSSLRGASCSCPGALGPPGYCRERGASLRPLDRGGSHLHQIQAPLRGLPEEAGGLEEEGDRRGPGRGGGMDDHRQFVEPW